MGVDAEIRAEIYRLRYAERLSTQKVALITGVSPSTVNRLAPGKMGSGRVITSPVKARMRRLRARGLTNTQIARATGVSRTAVTRNIGPTVRIDNSLLRQAFLSSDLSAYQVALRMGWYNGSTGKGDGSRVKRSLGILRSGATFQRRVSIPTAVALAAALGVDPHEVEL